MKRVREGNLNLDDPALKRQISNHPGPYRFHIARQDLIRHGTPSISSGQHRWPDSPRRRH